jgi:hypothetical protein
MAVHRRVTKSRVVHAAISERCVEWDGEVFLGGPRRRLRPESGRAGRLAGFALTGPACSLSALCWRGSRGSTRLGRQFRSRIPRSASRLAIVETAVHCEGYSCRWSSTCAPIALPSQVGEACLVRSWPRLQDLSRSGASTDLGALQNDDLVKHETLNLSHRLARGPPVWSPSPHSP